VASRRPLGSPAIEGDRPHVDRAAPSPLTGGGTTTNPDVGTARAEGRGRAALLEALIVLAVVIVFSRLHAAAGADAAAATANAAALQSLEQALNLDIELAANRWLVEHDILIPLAVVVYRSYYVVILGVLVWVFVRHADVYRHVRRTLVAMTLLALPVFWALPISPPRFALPGVVDIIATHDPIAGAASVDLDNGRNHYSAMPSLHVGWSAWCAYAVWFALRERHPRLALLAWVFPLVMITDVFTTGNHYVLDVVGSAALLALSIIAARVWARLSGLWPTRGAPRPGT
jgi:hypothetical protein